MSLLCAVAEFNSWRQDIRCLISRAAGPLLLKKCLA